MPKILRSYIVLLLAMLLPVAGWAQDDTTGIIINTPKLIDKYHISGVVKDKATGEPVPFATVFFKGTETGTPANLDGVFDLIVEKLPNDTIVIGALGYSPIYKRLDTTKRDFGIFATLETSKKNLQEVVVLAGEDPAIALLKKVIRRKDYNNPDREDNYYYQAYNKMEIDLLNLSKEAFERLPVPYIRNFGFIYDNMDTAENGERFLPFFLTEALSDYYFQRSPRKAREIIKASQIRGINNKSLTQYLGTMNLDVNPYDNYMLMFDKKFVSPINNAGPVFYAYKITDTSYINNYRIIHINYKPLRPGENCFSGTIRIVDSIYALEYIYAQLPRETNLNWVKGASFYKQYSPIDDSVWFCTKEHLTAKMMPPGEIIKPPGFIARKTTFYNNILLNNKQVTDAIAKHKAVVTIADTARNVTEETWTTLRPDTLSKNERAIYNMFDSLEQNPKYTKFRNMARTLATGVIRYGPLEFGPYWSLYSFNQIEGSRVRFSMGTTPKLFKDAYINGFIAYGFGDQRYKGSLSVLWLLKRQPRSYVFASYTSDIDRTVNYYDRVSYDNIFSMAVRKQGVPPKFMFAKDLRFEYMKEFYNGFRYMFTFLNKQFDPYNPLPDVTIFKDGDGRFSNTAINTEVNLQLRFAHKEQFLEGNYYRFSLGSKYPIVDLRLGLGVRGIMNSAYEYKRVSLTVSDNIRIAPLGSIYINVFGGRYFGTLPYTLLETHPGNEFLAYNKNAFNMMTLYEFISDRFVGFNVEHSLGNGVFNYIPLVKKLKFRQFWTAKGIIGSLDDANKALNLNKGFGFKTLEGKPYIELGTGVENILKLFRVDFIWRVTPKALPTEPRQQYFGIFGSMKFNL